MNEKILSIILNNEKALVPLIFTAKQIGILKKRFQG